MTPAEKAFIDKARAEGRILRETGVSGVGPEAPPEELASKPIPDRKARRKAGVRADGKTTEEAFQKRVIDFAQEMGWLVAHFRPAWAGDRMITPVAGDGKGFPDLILVKGNSKLAAELKVPPHKPTQEQLVWLARLIVAGIPAWVWEPEDWPLIELVLRS
jgi:hypothetical protein